MPHTQSLVLAIIMLICSSSASADVYSATGNSELREAAEEAYRNRDAGTATLLYLEMTARFPDDPDAWYGLSRAYEWGDDLENAISTAERVQDMGYYSQSSLSYRVAQLHHRAGHTDDALEWIARALAEGYEDRPEIQSDEVFAALLDDPRFIKLAGILPSGNVSRTEGLRFDIDYLVEEAQRMHAGPKRTAFSAGFLDRAAALQRSIPELSDIDVLAGMMRLMAILNDGHTAIYGPDPDTPLNLSGDSLPLKFYWFDEGVYIVDGTGVGVEFAGSRVLKIGDMPTEEVLAEMSVYRGVDNAMTWKWMGPQFYLGSAPMLQLVGAATAGEPIALVLEDQDGQVSTHTFDASNGRAQRKLRPSPAADGEVPMYLSKVDTSYWLASFPDRNALYFQFNQVRNAENETIEEFSDKLRKRLRDEGATTLIIDARHNNGGNNTLVNPLIRALVGFEQSSDENRIYVITGRNTFSAAQNFINRVEAMTDAVFVGEPSASSPNFVGEETNLLLPYSRVRGSVSTRYWQDSQPYDHRVWITPAIPVAPTAADYFSGRDAALEAVFILISPE